MARAPNNFFYQQNPMAAIGDGLARAIFGDPQARMEQQRVQAEMEARAAQAERDRAAATYDSARTAGVNTANLAAEGLPALFEAFGRSRQPAPPLPSIDSPEFAAFDTPLEMPAPQPDPTQSLAALVGALAQMQGDKVDPRHAMGAFAAFGGDDELARRGMIAQGQTPGEEFAVTPERADDVARAGYAADLAKALGVAEINNRDDIPVAQIGADAERDSAFIGAGAKRDVAEIQEGGGTPRGIRNNNPGNLEFGPFARQMGATGSDGRFAIFPTFEDGVRAQERLLAGGSYIGGGNNTIAKIINRYAPPSDGNPVSSYAQYVSRVTGIPVNQPVTAAQVPIIAEAMRQFENGGSYGGSGGKASEAPKPAKAALGAEDVEALQQQFEAQLPGFAEAGTPQTRAYLLDRAAQIYQRTGNLIGAVQQAIRDNAAEADARRNRPASAPAGGGSSAGGKTYTQADVAEAAQATGMSHPDIHARMRAAGYRLAGR